METTTLSPLAPTLADEVADLRGTFDKGHTSEDAESALGIVSKALGFNLCIIWAFEDMWGCGGDSELMVVDQKGRFADVPGELVEFLYEKPNEIDFEAVRAAFKPGRVRYRRDLSQGEGREHNYVLKTYQGEAPGC